MTGAVALSVQCFPGLSRDEALQLRFGTAAPPALDCLVFIQNALPPEGVAYDWALCPRESHEFHQGWAACQAAIEREG